MQSPLRLVVVLVLLAIPLAEIALLIKLGQRVGFWPVVTAVAITGLAGVRVIQTQGLATFRRMSSALVNGKEPHRELVDGALLLLAGVLLVLPGPIGDICGLMLLLPPVRSLLVGAIFARATVFRGSEAGGDAGSERGRDADPGMRDRPAAGTVIEGEFERLDERTIDPQDRPPSDPHRR